MLRKNLWPNKASFWTIWDFVKFENHEVIKIVLIYYWIFATSVTNEFQCLGHQRLFWGEKLVVEKNCFIPNGRYKPYQNLGKKYFFCQRTFWPLNGLVLQYQYICVTLYVSNANFFFRLPIDTGGSPRGLGWSGRSSPGALVSLG